MSEKHEFVAIDECSLRCSPLSSEQNLPHGYTMNGLTITFNFEAICDFCRNSTRPDTRWLFANLQQFTGFSRQLNHTQNHRLPTTGHTLSEITEDLQKNSEEGYGIAFA